VGASALASSHAPIASSNLDSGAREAHPGLVARRETYDETAPAPVDDPTTRTLDGALAELEQHQRGVLS